MSFKFLKTIFSFFYNKKEKFIILSTARSGSNYLVDLINSSTASVFVHGELFNLSISSKTLWPYILRNPVGFLARIIYLTQKKYNLVGFKMFYYHATSQGFGNNNPELYPVSKASVLEKTKKLNEYIVKNYDFEEVIRRFQKVWDYLSASRFKVVHLKRRNLFHSFVSLHMAHITDSWTSQDPRPAKNITFRIEYENCLRYFEKISKYEEEYEVFFKNNNVLTIYYEDLKMDRETELQKIQDFLSIDIERPRSRLAKQEKRHVSEVVENYHDLQKKFLGTRWEVFFE